MNASEQRYRVHVELSDGSRATVSRSGDDPLGLTLEDARRRVAEHAAAGVYRNPVAEPCRS